MTTSSIRSIVAVQNFEKADKGYWTDIGTAVVNPNGTIDLTFDAFPLGEDITIQLRDRKTTDETPTKPAPNEPDPPRKQIVAIISEEHDGKSETRVIKLGLAFPNKDRSYALRFSYFPARPAQIQLRDIRSK